MFITFIFVVKILVLFNRTVESSYYDNNITEKEDDDDTYDDMSVNLNYYDEPGMFQLRSVAAHAFDIKDFPYLVAIEGPMKLHSQAYLSYCGGALLSRRWALTAAHCVHKKYTEIIPQFVRAGSSAVGKGGIKRKIIKIVIHPKFKTTFSNDLALLKVKAPFPKNNPNIRIISLVRKRILVGAPVTVVGWTSTNLGLKGKLRRQLKKKLRANIVTIISKKPCRKYFRTFGQKVFAKNVCATSDKNIYPDPRDSKNCVGQPGGPLVNRNKNELVGLMSYGIKCGLPGFPGVYVNMYFYRGWVRKILRSGSKMRIIGGKRAKIEDFSYIVAIEGFSKQYGSELVVFCGGTIIHKYWVVTAGHCLEESISDYVPQHVRAGTDRVKKGGFITKFKKIIVHPNFPENIDFDIGLIKVEKPFPTNNPKIKPIDLTDVKLKSGTSVVVSGWGNTVGGKQDEILEEYPEYLQATTIKIMNHSKCSTFFRKRKHSFTKNNVCAGASRKGPQKDACVGDSGGPLVDPNTKKLVGVISWGIECGIPGYPGVYISIHVFKEWILENIQSSSSSPEEYKNEDE